MNQEELELAEKQCTAYLAAIRNGEYWLAAHIALGLHYGADLARHQQNGTWEKVS